MHTAFPKKNLETISTFAFCKMPELEDLCLQDVGLLNLNQIDSCFPELSVLDVSKNKIFTIEAIEILHKLEDLAEVNFAENPICVHKHLK